MLEGVWMLIITSFGRTYGTRVSISTCHLLVVLIGSNSALGTSVISYKTVTPGWRMNTNNIRNMNTNTLCVEHLKYEYTQFLLFIFTNIIRSSTPPLATITALQKAAKELPKYVYTYVPRARTYDLLIFRLPLCQLGQ